MNISIPVEDRQPVHITPRFDPRNILPDPPRIMADSAKKGRARGVEKFVVAAMSKTLLAIFWGIGIATVAALVYAFPDLKWPVLGIILYCAVMRGIKEAVRDGVKEGTLAPPKPPPVA